VDQCATGGQFLLVDSTDGSPFATVSQVLNYQTTLDDTCLESRVDFWCAQPVLVVLLATILPSHSHARVLIQKMPAGTPWPMVPVDSSGTLHQFCLHASNMNCGLASVMANFCERKMRANKLGPKHAHVDLAKDCWSSRPELDWQSLVEWLHLDPVQAGFLPTDAFKHLTPFANW
jgi:hypothetical protein